MKSNLLINKRVIGLLFILGLIKLVTINICGQSKLYQFKHMTADDGLSSSQVISILQDYKGLMWIGTYDGLNKYDGSKVTIYKYNPEDSSSISENHIMSIFEARNKDLFIGTLGGLSLYDRNTDKFVNYKFIQSSALYNLQISILNIFEDSLENLWLATSSELVYFERHKNKITEYIYDPANPSGLSDKFTETVFIDSRKRIWISTNKGLNLFNPKTKTFELIKYCKTHNENISAILFRNIIEDRYGNVYFGSNEGMFCLENGHSHKNGLTHFKYSPTNPAGISHNYIKSFFIDDKDNLWIGTENGGLNIFNIKNKDFTHIRINEFNPKSINNESIHAITRDRNQNLWIGTFGGGVNLLLKDNDFIIHYQNLPGALQSLGHNIVKAFLEDTHGNMWVATDGGGLNMFNRKTGHFTRYNTSNSKISSNAVLCLIQGEPNELWIGTWAGGLVNYNTRNNTFKSYTTNNSDITDDNIHSIARDKKGNLWLGSQNGGLIYFDLKKNKFKAYTPDNSTITSRRVSVIRIDHNEKIYIGSTISMQVFDPKTNKFEMYTHNPADTNSLSNIAVIDILLQNDSCVWVTTDNGLNLFNPLKKSFKRYSTRDGLPNNIIQGITLDTTGILWITTNYGISRFDYKHRTFKNYTKSDGLQGNEFTDKSIYTDKSGSIFAGGKNGFNIISPYRIPENNIIPQIAITDFHIFNQPVKIEDNGSPLKKHISETQQITLTYKQSVLTFYFSVLDYTNPLRNQYAYKMEPFDNDWVYCGNKREATYTNLNPGRYIFRVKGSNNDGIWNETGTSVEITITPPWWKTRLAYISYIIIVLALFGAIYYLRLGYLEHQKTRLEKMVEKRTHELQLSNEIINETNKLLREHQHEIEQKNNMLLEQADQLNETNTLLEERQMRIEEQTEELYSQKEELETQRDVLSELNATKDKLFSILAHDLRSPFNTIIGYSDLLYNKIDTYSIEKIKSQVGFIRDGARDTYGLLNNLLEWSRSQRGVINCEFEEIDLNECLESELRILKKQASRKEIEIKTQTTGQKKGIVADTNLLQTVIRNLISNAIKFSKTGDTIWVLTEYMPNEVIFSVVDKGTGMPKDVVDKLFTISGNVSQRGTAGEKGTGLGLLLCADFIEKHNGKIWVESEVGQGSKFSFRIPSNHYFDKK